MKVLQNFRGFSSLVEDVAVVVFVVACHTFIFWYLW